MKLIKKDEPVHIPADTYEAKLKDINSYKKNNKKVYRLVIQFNVDYEAEDNVVPFFAPIKLSLSDRKYSSRLAENLNNVGLLSPILQQLGIKKEVLSGKEKAVAETEEDAEMFIDVLKQFMEGKVFKVFVKDDNTGNKSIISEMTSIVGEEK